MKNKICTQCNRTFKPSSRHLKCPICRAKKTICPCGNQKNRQSTHCLPCHNKSNKKPSGWVGNPCKNYDGYIKRRVVDHPSGSRYIFEHRLVMEGILGRFLLGRFRLPKPNLRKHTVTLYLLHFEENVCHKLEF
jgi:hypothetical protein